VVLGAHYDTVGVEGSSYGGADDNGSGTVALMAIAEAFAAGARPKRSVLFMWHAGEEKGLWGSRYFVEHPSIPLNQIVAYINLDMVGRSKKADDSTPENAGLTSPDEVYVLGPRLTSTEVGELSERVNRSYLNLRLNYRYDDPKDPERLFRRSDNYPFAQKGIPIIYYFTGFHADYHAPSDMLKKIDYLKIEKIARTVFLTSWELANSMSRPRFDKVVPK
jgi:Zn-dependent M28 family amino/carboxypeptidase